MSKTSVICEQYSSANVFFLISFTPASYFNLWVSYRTLRNFWVSDKEILIIQQTAYFQIFVIFFSKYFPIRNIYFFISKTLKASNSVMESGTKLANHTIHRWGVLISCCVIYHLMPISCVKLFSHEIVFLTFFLTNNYRLLLYFM